ncbi:bifunctional [glutamine synthetase] adenylyltransferase/[glutamine synthetase]-adenylyl-L-tyrosine phosphorylase [Cognatishimia sp. F0-27]|uniref:bifunctional [glutamine synthetase] adenylyltransferase/[glutamine synthetase]-adenylyl-L-tyrosine phosphorylase n=1 Tax=Cognatishimia sp. F0-27 TaxID=2816855 RepID=UPI001D0C7290|nr:bifunctional [glutamine synthetase] adenylyltransferase/[glutamine synthetase]-adenylyl-L-tyrosine phosphorylase [Cognatishimia sp. F0-27]MCC1494492.1 bifunctional [glutamine synthetase] adenylyltransferase/[glutamine synthetase]-adenylyl-L-tyrosine phosphorylase [Cognatishimia sp. F0-27]
MTLADRITRMPRAHEPELGLETRAAAPWADGPLADLLEGVGGSSPYLKSLITKESAWLEAASDDPDAAFAAIVPGLAEAEDLPVALRQAKRRVALITALCDLAGIWPLETVTGHLTHFADNATDQALRGAIAREIRRGKIPGATPDDLDSAAGMVVLAMGKMGAGELNYSSDIDLICLFDESRFDRDAFHEARSAFVRATRTMAATLSDLTGDGYVFRTDLRLRPDPAVTPVCMAMEAAERYYESLGRTWERAAYIKARPAAGDIAAGTRFLDSLTPFVWRKHLDFAAIQDAHDMRLRIRDAKGYHGPIDLPGHDMKLGRGGIREIEFFTQTRQLIAGGRDPGLRARGTVPGLDALAGGGWVPRDVADRLAAHYRAHRLVEHRVQMVGDAQTHALPKSAAGFERLACLMATDVASLRAGLKERLEDVHHLTEGFFAPDGGVKRAGKDALAPEGTATGDDLPDSLRNSDIPARWPSYAALRSDRAQALFNRLRPVILSKLARAAKPDEALMAFDSFLAGLPAGVQLFSLFHANPQLIDLLVDITATSPDLAKYLARNAQVFDAVIGGDFFAPWPGRDRLRRDLADALDHESDYERQLDRARRWGKEWHFRVGVHFLRGLIDAEEAGAAYADLAEATLAALWPVVQREFGRKHGAPPGRGAVVVGMGSLGVRRLNTRSDLDVIVIYDADGVETSDGRRPLPARTYYARLTQALVTAMTAPMAEGRLYEVDMRLRPSGNQGPVATSWAAFQAYQREEAWVWEHLALTRARVVAGPAALGADVEAFRAELLSEPRAAAEVLAAVADMRARIAGAKGRGGPWEAKLGAGRLQEVELLGQAAALISGRPLRQTRRALRAADWLDVGQKEAVIAADRLFSTLHLAARLVSEGPLDPETLGAGGCAFLCRATGAGGIAELESTLENTAAAAAEVLDAVLPSTGDAA